MKNTQDREPAFTDEITDFREWLRDVQNEADFTPISTSGRFARNFTRRPGVVPFGKFTR